MSTHEQTAPLPSNPEKATLEGKNKFLGFWFFLAGETVLFATLFGTYLGLTREIPTGPTPEELFKLEIVFIMTVVLLTSSLTSVLAIVNMKQNNYARMQFWFIITVLLGWVFVGFEIYEFYEYVHHEHFTFMTSAFSSAFYTLLGFHGGHVLFGTLWIATLILQATKKGITLTTAPKFYVASLYWHFVDVVWVFIFTVVYLMGKVG